MTDKQALNIVYGFAFLCFLIFFSPHLRFDSLRYIAPARSLVFDKDLNVYNEKYYCTNPCWNDVVSCAGKGKRKGLLEYVHERKYTEKGYANILFPVGNTIYWLTPLALVQLLVRAFPKVFPGMNTGYSMPFVLGFTFWNLFFWLVGCRIAYSVLRRFFPSHIAVFSLIAGIGGGNMLPFVFIDVCFTHSLDFVLLTAFIELWFQIRETPDPKKVLFWGGLLGFSVIIRYQNIGFILIPLYQTLELLITRHRLDKDRWMHPGRFLSFFSLAFFPVVALQLLYWKIIHGVFFISAKTMGASGIPSFNPMKPRLLEMFFSEFHGLFSWTPLWILAFMGFAFLLAERKAVNWVLLAAFATQVYYNSCRTEWWNLGYSVRRFAGLSVLMMWGIGGILSRVNRFSWKKILYGVCVIAIAWNILFMMTYYAFDFHPSSHSIFPELVQHRKPYSPKPMKIIVPSLRETWRVIHDFQWLQTESMVFRKQHFHVLNRIALICAGLTVFWLSSRFFNFFKKRVTVLLWCLAGIFLASGVSFVISDVCAHDIYALELESGRVTGKVLKIRLHDDAVFWGENVRLKGRRVVQHVTPPVFNPDAIHVMLMSRKGLTPSPEDISCKLFSPEGTVSDVVFYGNKTSQTALSSGPLCRNCKDRRFFHLEASISDSKLSSLSGIEVTRHAKGKFHIYGIWFTQRTSSE